MWQKYQIGYSVIMLSPMIVVYLLLSFIQATPTPFKTIQDRILFLGLSILAYYLIGKLNLGKTSGNKEG